MEFFLIIRIDFEILDSFLFLEKSLKIASSLRINKRIWQQKQNFYRLIEVLIKIKSDEIFILNLYLSVYDE